MSKIIVTSIGAFHSRAVNIKDLYNILPPMREQSVQKANETADQETVNKEVLKFLTEDEIRRMDKVSKIALISGLDCLKELSFRNITQFKNEIGVVANTCFGAISSSKEFIMTALQKGDKNASPIIFPFSVPNAATGLLTMKLGVNGFNTTLSGFNPVGYAFDLLNLKRASGLFVLGFEEVTEFIKNINLKDNIFFHGDYAEGSITLFMTEEEFAKEHKLPRLFEICGYSSYYNYATENSFDNSEFVEEDVISESLNYLLTTYNLDVQDFDVIVSSFIPNSDPAKMEQNYLSGLFGSFSCDVIYPKSELGESFGVNNLINVVAGYNYLKNRQSNKYALINNYDIGGNFSSLVIKI